MKNGKKIGLVLAASGIGKRMNSEKSKQLIEIDSKPILLHSLNSFLHEGSVDECVITVNESIMTEVKNLTHSLKSDKKIEVVLGGSERQDSVYQGLKYFKQNPPHIALVHDAVRPFVGPDLISRVIDSAIEFGSAIPAIKLKDTIKRTDDGKVFSETPDRNLYRLIQTPQGFNFELLLNAYDDAFDSGFYGTDDASLVEKYGTEPFIVDGDERNIKITTPYDLQFAQIIIKDFNYLI